MRKANHQHKQRTVTQAFIIDIFCKLKDDDCQMEYKKYNNQFDYERKLHDSNELLWLKLVLIRSVNEQSRANTFSKLHYDKYISIMV